VSYSRVISCGHRTRQSALGKRLPARNGWRDQSDNLRLLPKNKSDEGFRQSAARRYLRHFIRRCNCRWNTGEGGPLGASPRLIMNRACPR
jgi:hypothetical protein